MSQFSMAADLPSTSADPGAVVVGPSAGPGSGSAAAAEPARKPPFTSRFDAQATATSSAARPPPARSGAVADSANDGDKNAIASGACDEAQKAAAAGCVDAEALKLLVAQATEAGEYTRLLLPTAKCECKKCAAERNRKNML